MRVILALDDDEGGAKGNHAVRLDLAFAGIRAEVVPAGWLGDVGAKDPADLLDPRVITDRRVAGEAYDGAIGALLKVYGTVESHVWDAEEASCLIGAMYERCGAAAEGVDNPPRWPEDCDQVIEVACRARDWSMLYAAVASCEMAYLEAVAATTGANSLLQNGEWEVF